MSFNFFHATGTIQWSTTLTNQNKWNVLGFNLLRGSGQVFSNSWLDSTTNFDFKENIPLIFVKLGKQVPFHVNIRLITFSIVTLSHVIHICLVERFSYDLEMKTRKQNTNNKQTEIRAIWLVYRTDINARGFWLVKWMLGWKNFMPDNFLEINRYFALTSHCNTIGQSNNTFSILGFSSAGKRTGHVLIF